MTEQDALATLRVSDYRNHGGWIEIGGGLNLSSKNETMILPVRILLRGKCAVEDLRTLVSHLNDGLEELAAQVASTVEPTTKGAPAPTKKRRLHDRRV